MNINIDQKIKFLLIRNDLPLLIQRKLLIAPAQGLGVVRRAIFFALFAWLPIAIWAATQGRLISNDSIEPLAMHFSIHVRCLLAIPLMILAEGLALKIEMQLVPQFITSGLIISEQREKFYQVLRAMARLRDATIPWVVIIGLTVLWLIGSPNDFNTHELSWAFENHSFSFGGWWFLYVVRPLFVLLLLGWFWRLALLVKLFRDISKFDLELVPSHPDKMGGLGFLQVLPAMFALVTFSISAVLASRWTHDALYHAHSLSSYKFPFAAFVIFWSLILLLPLMLFIPRMAMTKRSALRDYRALLTRHGQLVHKRWIKREAIVQDDILDSPEIGPVADINTIYEAVAKMSSMPIGKLTILPLLAPIAIPMIVVVATQIPIQDVLMKLIKTVI